MGKLLKILFVVVVLLAGGLYGHYRYTLKTNSKEAPANFLDYLNNLCSKLIGRDNKNTKGSSTPLKQASGTSQEGTKEGDERKAIEKAQKEEIEKLRKEVNELYKVADYEKAQNVIKLIKEKIEKFRVKATQESSRWVEETGKWAEKYSKRIWVFATLVSLIEGTPFASGKNIYLLTTLDTGTEIWVFLIKDDNKNVEVEKMGGIRTFFPKESVKMEPKTKEDFKQFLKGELEKREKNIHPNDYNRNYFDLVVFTCKYGLKEEITRLLEKTFQVPNSENILKILPLNNPNEYIKALLESFDRPMTAKQPDRPLPPRGDASPPPIIPDGKMTDADCAKIEEIRQLTKEAKELMTEAVNQWESSNRFKLGKSAREKLAYAQQLLIGLRNKYPDDPLLQGMEQEISELVKAVEDMFPAK